MAGKPNSHKWNDVQMVIVASSLVLTLSLWNLFAGPDRVKAIENQSTQQTVPITDAAPVAITPTLEPVKIMLGGAAPNQSQPQASVPATNSRSRGSGGGGSSGSGGGGGGGGGGTGGS